jgi:hypothetical protein
MKVFEADVTGGARALFDDDHRRNRLGDEDIAWRRVRPFYERLSALCLEGAGVKQPTLIEEVEE